MPHWVHSVSTSTNTPILWEINKQSIARQCATVYYMHTETVQCLIFTMRRRNWKATWNLLLLEAETMVIRCNSSAESTPNDSHSFKMQSESKGNMSQSERVKVFFPNQTSWGMSWKYCSCHWIFNIFWLKASSTMSCDMLHQTHIMTLWP